MRSRKFIRRQVITERWRKTCSFLRLPINPYSLNKPRYLYICIHEQSNYEPAVKTIHCLVNWISDKLQSFLHIIPLCNGYLSLMTDLLNSYVVARSRPETRLRPACGCLWSISVTGYLSYMIVLYSNLAFTFACSLDAVLRKLIEMCLKVLHCCNAWWLGELSRNFALIECHLFYSLIYDVNEKCIKPVH